MATCESTNPGDETFAVRAAKPEDCPEIVRLVRGLSIFEKIEDQVKIGAEEFLRDGFGEKPWFRCVVTENTDTRQLVGFCLFYYVYSTFQGRAAYLEDVYVDDGYRNKGLGTRMMSEASKIVLSEGCVRFDFVVLDWNPAVRLYRRLGATELPAWSLWRFERQQLESLARGEEVEQVTKNK